MRKKTTLIASSIVMSLTAAVTAKSAEWKIFGEPFIASARAQSIDWQKVDETLGRKPAVSGDARRYGFPRSDLTCPRMCWPWRRDSR